ETGFRVTGGALTALSLKLGRLAAEDAVFAFCGSLPPGMTRGDLAGLFGVVRREGGRLVGDLNGADLRSAIEARAEAITPNVEELGDVLGEDEGAAAEPELVEACRRLCDRVETVLLTRGARGALAVRRDEAFACAVAIPSPRNTVGCGDAFLAGYLAALWRGDSVTDRLRHAVGCGSANALTDAAGDIDPAQVAALADRADLRPLG
ncbi:MAG: PfkB family carbohydrate kinase, partial [bacterium]